MSVAYTIEAVTTDGDHLEITCESCGAQILVEPLMRTARCPYCASPKVVDRPASTDRPDPVFTIGFAVDQAMAAGAIRERTGKKWLAPEAFRKARVDRLRGIYLPGYMWSATQDSVYSAVVGEHYETTRIDPRSKRVKRERRIEYHELRGQHASYVTEVLVTASRGLPNDEIEAIEPFDLEELLRYTPGLVSGWISEEPSLPLEECRRLAREEAQARVEGELRGFMPGDTLQRIKSHTRFRSESMDLVLLPVWVFALQYDPAKSPVRFVVNGQTGAVHGSAPVSWTKIAAIAAAIAGLVGMIATIGWLL